MTHELTIMHELKILPEYFQAVACGIKNFELRKNDRDYQLDDILVLREWDGERYTGQTICRRITYIYEGNGEYGLSDGYCILGFSSSPWKPGNYGYVR